MILTDEGYILRIFIGEARRHEHLPLYEWLTRKALDQKMAGVTVVEGVMGFGGRSRVNTSGLARLSSDPPIVVEIVDSRQKLEDFLELVEGAISEGLATLEKLEICFYRTGTETSPVKSISR